MYDPMTVAHEIKSPFRGEPSKLWPKGYRNTLITIWHIDPETPGRGHRTDDSCGWFSPPTTSEERERIRKIGARQFSEIFRKRDVLAKGDPDKYAYVCYEPSAYDAVYWAWRAIKRERTKHVWMYGGEWDSPRPKFMQSEVGIYHSDCSGMTVALAKAEPQGTA